MLFHGVLNSMILRDIFKSFHKTFDIVTLQISKNEFVISSTSTSKTMRLRYNIASTIFNQYELREGEIDILRSIKTDEIIKSLSTHEDNTIIDIDDIARDSDEYITLRSNGIPNKLITLWSSPHPQIRYTNHSYSEYIFSAKDFNKSIKGINAAECYIHGNEWCLFITRDDELSDINSLIHLPAKCVSFNKNNVSKFKVSDFKKINKIFTTGQIHVIISKNYPVCFFCEDSFYRKSFWMAPIV